MVRCWILSRLIRTWSSHLCWPANQSHSIASVRTRISQHSYWYGDRAKAYCTFGFHSKAYPSRVLQSSKEVDRYWQVQFTGVWIITAWCQGISSTFSIRVEMWILTISWVHDVHCKRKQFNQLTGNWYSTEQTSFDQSRPRGRHSGIEYTANAITYTGIGFLAARILHHRPSNSLPHKICSRRCLSNQLKNQSDTYSNRRHWHCTLRFPCVHASIYMYCIVSL